MLHIHFYSLYRATSLEEADEKFNAFFQRLPVFVTIAKDVSNIYV